MVFAIPARAQQVAARYGKLPQVAAVALSGSQTAHVADPDSDMDLYVYWQEPLSVSERRAAALQFGRDVEINNQFWEPGDEWIDVDTGVKVDVMFRQTSWIEQQLTRILERHEAAVGYSTCLWHNVVTAQPLVDHRGWFQALRTKASQPYPDALRLAIIAKNYPILRDGLSAYLHQLENALKRNDRVSINHRTAALLASYFDIIFAINRLPHPGEKRLVSIVEKQCAHVPEGMREDIERLLTAAGGLDRTLLDNANRLIESLAALLLTQGLLN